jgi:hypothetical protein
MHAYVFAHHDMSTMVINRCIQAYADYAAYELPEELLITQRSLLYDEAKRLLDKEEGRICLQTVQGLGVLWLK